MAQAYNNEWIDYSKTYYKFKIGATGAYRIGQSSLPAALAGVPVEQLQLWRNGSQVPIYTSSASGVLPANGFIEFWGEKNDGTPDKPLFTNPNYQINKVASLQTDTASFFLTVNTNTAQNIHYTTADNTIPSGATPLTSFLYTIHTDFNSSFNRGRAYDLDGTAGHYMYSCYYDVGEGFANILSDPASPIQNTFNNLAIAGGSSSATVSVGVAGVINSSRTVNITFNGSNVLSQALNGFDAAVFSNSSVTVNNNNINYSISKSSNSNDQVAVSFIELSYNRQFDFGGQSSFAFTLPATGQATYLSITNFNSGGAAPVLYDLTNGVRYVAATTSTPFGFYLQPSGVQRKLTLVSEAGGVATPVNQFVQRNFVDYSQAANQGNYLIITHSSLRAGSTDYVAQYSQYRASAAGGGFNTQIYDIDQLVDQFAFGIKKHPLSVKNFLRYAVAKFSSAPQYVFIIGHGLKYSDYYLNQSAPDVEQLNLVPSFGEPASDVLLASFGAKPIPSFPVGRLSAITPNEVSIYLAKVKQYEQALESNSQTIADKAWMKNIIQVSGSSSDIEESTFTGYLNNYQNIMQDTSYGGIVTNFNKTTTSATVTPSNVLMSRLFASGIGLVTYFGHASSITLAYNLNTPAEYQNPSKYPVFFVNGCDAGDYYAYNPGRLSVITVLPEAWVITPNNGAVAFVAGTTLGLDTYLNTQASAFFNSLSKAQYGQPFSQSITQAAIAVSNQVTPYDTILNYANSACTVLQGDPALKLATFAKPDFVVEQPQIIVSPSFISVADNSFHVKAYLYNIGKATGDSVLVEIKRQYPGGSSGIIFSKNIRSVRYMDSVEMDVPISPTRDIGQNTITVTINGNNHYDEITMSNNSASQNVFIYQDELTPVYPYNLSIVHDQGTKLEASTANALAPAQSYIMQLDTTTLFNSSFRIAKTVSSSIGGIVEFDPGISYTDSTVYYWRVAPVPASGGNYIWNTASFVYLANATSDGWNQSHLYQHLESGADRIYMDSASRTWKFGNIVNSLSFTHGIYNTSINGVSQSQIKINNNISSAFASNYFGSNGGSIVFSVHDPNSLTALFNQATPSVVGSGTYGGFMGAILPDGYPTAIVYGPTYYGAAFHNFEFPIGTPAQREAARAFMDWVPTGYYVTARIYVSTSDASNAYAPVWKTDPATASTGNLYQHFINAGFSTLDSFNRVRTWVFVYKKGDNTFLPVTVMSEGPSDPINGLANPISLDSLGYITSPLYGPAKSWKTIEWRGYSSETPSTNNVSIDVIGVNAAGAQTVITTLNATQQNYDISGINAATYPYLQLRMRNADSIFHIPYQLKYWRILYNAVPEGGMAANIAYSGGKDTLAIGEPLNLSIAFKNISKTAYGDSITVNTTITDKGNIVHTIPMHKLKPLTPGDTAMVNLSIPGDTSVTKGAVGTFNLPGNNTLYINVNPAATGQLEQTYVNNFLYKNIYVNSSNYNPNMDVTFDGIHILNNDIVSARPNILIKIKSDSKYLLITDTSAIRVQLVFPDGSVRNYSYTSDTLMFTPSAANTSDNAASADFKPSLTQDGQYQLIVTGKDMQGNPAGNASYTITFQVYNKPMISNVFNYPNPFTTSTAFVFTLTGSQVPQNIRIEILTITGKIVKEITMAELGPINIGRNITQYKWDGTDMYGQKLANGVYLYRIVTNLDGKRLDKYSNANDGSVNTDKFFKNGYGKMYLMR
jgi:hypothetical protein